MLQKSTKTLLLMKKRIAAETHYECANFPGLGVTLIAVIDGKRTTVAGVGTPRHWTVPQCLDYARASGHIVETQTDEDGVTVYRWFKS